MALGLICRPLRNALSVGESQTVGEAAFESGELRQGADALTAAGKVVDTNLIMSVLLVRACVRFCTH